MSRRAIRDVLAGRFAQSVTPDRAEPAESDAQDLLCVQVPFTGPA
jgi:hypothetical protein